MTLFKRIIVPDFELQLTNEDLPHTCGYSPEDSHFVLRHFAEATGAGYIHLLDVLRKNTPESLLEQIATAFTKNTVIMDVAHVWHKSHPNYEMLDVLSDWIRTVYQSNDPSVLPKKILFPITVVTEDKVSHAMVMAIDWDVEAEKLHVSLFEQHAHKDSGALDFSKEIDAIGSRFSERLGATFHSNKDHYCRIEKVCGIASIETIKTLAMSQKPAYYFAENVGELLLSERDILAAHEGYLMLASREHGVQSDEIAR